MQAFEVMGKIDKNGQIVLDEPLEVASDSRVRVILLMANDSDFDPDDTPIEEIKASLRRALQEVKEGKTRPIFELWERIDG
jgi:hypothetical protein